MTKYIILIVLVLLAVVVLVGCTRGSAVLNGSKTYKITSDIHSLDFEIGAAEFTIEEADEFRVESNLKNLSVTEENGVLTIKDKAKANLSYSDAVLKLYIPKDITFEDALISTGAAKLSAETLSANTLKLNTGAGKVEFGFIEVLDSAKIKGGAGEISINDGTLRNLNLNLGVGELNMTAKLLGESDLRFGVGESDITLLGNRADYSFDIKNGVGNITLDGENSTFFANSTNGENLVKIKGGVGATNIEFRVSQAYPNQPES